jgi:anti-anti-sigma factor
VAVDPLKVGFDSPLNGLAAHIEVICSDCCIEVSVAGDLCGSMIGRLWGCLDNAIDDGVGRIVLDLAAVGYMDSRSLTVMMQAQARIAEVGGTFIIVGTSPLNVRLFEVAGLISYLSREPAEPS